ncbi:MAG: hypothetical protein AAF674_16775 [Pseudomonadota bacterium]
MDIDLFQRAGKLIDDLRRQGQDVAAGTMEQLKSRASIADQLLTQQKARNRVLERQLRNTEAELQSLVEAEIAREAGAA